MPREQLKQLIQALKPILEIQDDELLLPNQLKDNLYTLQSRVQKKKI